MINDGKTDIYAIVRAIKDKKLRGEKVQIKKSATKVSDVYRKAARDKDEIVEINGMLYDLVGPCLTTRFGAWCAGDISTSEFFASVEAYCKEHKKPYKMPQFIKDAAYGTTAPTTLSVESSN